MAFANDKEYLKDLNKKLYNKEGPPSYAKQKLSTRQIPTNNKWKKGVKPKKRPLFNGSSLPTKLFWIALIFFVLTSSYALYRLFINPAEFSPQNVEIVVQAPASVSGGEETPIEFLITNNNKVGIEGAVLEVSYPEGVVFPSEQPKENRILRLPVGTILPGQEVAKRASIIVFGEENTEKIFNIVLEYRVEGSSATFSTYREYPLILATSPISLTTTMPSEVNVGEEMHINITALSNTTVVLDNFTVAIDYPFGFVVTSVDPQPLSSDGAWFLGDLAPGQRVSVDIKGKLSGEVEDIRTFRVFAGTADTGDTGEIKVVYNSVVKTVAIKKPFVGVDFVIAGVGGPEEVIVNSGDRITGEIVWTNNLASQILNGKFEVSMSYPTGVVDEGSINPDRGFYRSSQKKIIWDQTTDRALTIMEPRESGVERLAFSIEPLSNTSIRNPEVRLELLFTGERFSPIGGSEPISITLSKYIKINSAAALTSDGLYFVGDFDNNGPLPPQADVSTTYTIVWSVVNASNVLVDTVVQAQLPIYVRWLGAYSPTTDNVTFNNTTGVVKWNLGTLDAGVGIESSVKQLSFQVELFPSTSQIGETPTLISTAELSAKDVFTGDSIILTQPQITTHLPQDPLFNRDTHSRVIP